MVWHLSEFSLCIQRIPLTIDRFTLQRARNPGLSTVHESGRTLPRPHRREQPRGGRTPNPDAGPTSRYLWGARARRERRGLIGLWKGH